MEMGHAPRNDPTARPVTRALALLTDQDDWNTRGKNTPLVPSFASLLSFSVLWYAAREVLVNLPIHAQPLSPLRNPKTT